MTREEAIKLLEHISIAYTPTDAYGDYDDTEPYEEAIDMAIEALSAETHEIRTETHGVCLISKDDAMGAGQDHFNDDGFKGYDDGQKMMDRIKSLPSADRPHEEI